MNKILLLAINLFLIPQLHAQQATIMGIPFGSSFEEVRDNLDQRFKREPNSPRDISTLLYHNVVIGEFIFEAFQLWFHVGSTGSKLHSADLHMTFKDKNEAIKMRERLKKLYSQKYSCIIPFKNGDNFIAYKFGYNNEASIGMIIISRTELPSGIKYSLDVMYMPEHNVMSDI